MTAAFPDLFGAPFLPGLNAAENVIDEREAAVLTASIDAAGLAPFRFQGWLGKRLTRSFGWSYDFDDRNFAQTDPIPDWLEPLRERAAAFAGLDPAALAHALVIRYDPGAGIGWHRDRPVFADVIGISLGAPATMRFRRRTPTGFERINQPLAPRSIYKLTSEARHDWEHSIAPIDRTRWSVTFRTLSPARP